MVRMPESFLYVFDNLYVSYDFYSMETFTYTVWSGLSEGFTPFIFSLHTNVELLPAVVLIELLATFI